MWQRIKDIPLTAYVKIRGSIINFRNDENGLSGVVVAVLLILVAVLAVVLIWTFLGTYIKDLWDRIFNKDTIG